MKKPESALTPSGQRSKPDQVSKTKSSINHQKQMYEKLFVKGFL